MTSKSKKVAKKPAKKTTEKIAAKKSVTKTKKTVPKKAAATTKKAVAKKPVVKKKSMPTRLGKASAEQDVQAKRQAIAKKSTLTKKHIATKKATPKKTIKKTDVVAEVEKVVKPAGKQVSKPRLGGNNNGKHVEIIESNIPSTDEETNVEDNIITDLPMPDKNTQQGKFARNFDKHQIKISSVKKGGPKPTGKKPLW